uniref:Trichohyalin-plectin-homology domain-containing protein n=1 Tax=Phytophthora ramorum TaxID=164328 RepID=H3GR74_PHYRM
MVVSGSAASLVPSYKELQLYAFVCFGIQWLSSLYAVPKQTEHFLDVTGSFTNVLLARLTARSICVALVSPFRRVPVLRISEYGEDKGFVEIRVNPLQFFSVWNIQGLWVLLTVVPVLVALAHGAHNPEMSPFDVAGSSLWALGYLMEVTADYQKTQFRRNEANKGKFIQSGLWFYSRLMISSQRSSACISSGGIPDTRKRKSMANAGPTAAQNCRATVGSVYAVTRNTPIQAYQAYKAQTSVLLPMPKHQATERAVSSAKLKKPGMGGRAKAVSLLMREEVKSDKRQAVADALTTKLTAKYAKQDPAFASSIASMANRLLLHSQKRVMEADIVALETVVKKLSLERQKLKHPGSNNDNKGGNSARRGSGDLVRAGASAGTEAGGRGPSLEGLKGQDEWVLLNALTLVEFETDQEKEKTRLVEKKRMQKAWLDAQQQEKAKGRDGEKKIKDDAFQHQQQDLSQWREQEIAKQQRQHEGIMKVRRERDEQLKQQKIALEQREAQRKQDEAAEVERVQAELNRLETDARHRRDTEHARMKKVQAENSLVQQHKSRVKLQEHQEDVELMEAYARRLAKEDEERMRRLQSNLQRRDQQQRGIAETLQTQMRKKALEDEHRAEKYQKEKDDAELLKQQLAQDARHKEALERQQFLLEQRAQKKQRERQEVEDDLTFARQYHSEGRAAIEAQHLQTRGIRQRNKSFQEKLVVQMVEQRQGQPMSPLHLPRTLMNSRERQLNAKLLQKLEDDDMGQKVLEKLSPSKVAPIITTSFY